MRMCRLNHLHPCNLPQGVDQGEEKYQVWTVWKQLLQEVEDMGPEEQDYCTRLEGYSFKAENLDLHEDHQHYLVEYCDHSIHLVVQ